MGCCIRTGTHISLDLASFCWKLIVGEEVKNADYDEMDRQLFEQIKLIANCQSE